MRNGTTDLEVGRIAAGDVRDEIRRGCNLAHYGVLAQALTGFIRPSLRWQEALTQVNVEYNPYTTFLDGEDFRLGGWGWLADLRKPLDQQVPPFPDVPFRAFATHVYRPTGSTGPTICQEGLQHPFGIASVLGFTQTGGIGNQPPPQSNLSAGPPERHQVVLSIGSSAILTIKGVATRTLGVHGAIEVELSGCNSDGCTARLGGFRLGTSRFIIEGHDVRLFEITNGAATGVLKGDSLVFPEFSGDVNAQLSDGRYARFPVKSGVLLARWEPDASRFVMAFSFDTKTAEGDEVTLNGTAFGAFANTSPTAKIQIVSPVASITANRSTIECDSPTGTTVGLDATSSADREDSALRFAWHTPAMPVVTTTPSLSLVDLAVGEHEVQLVAYDSRGFAGYDPLTLEVVDSQPPVISQQDLCIFPPNHRAVLLRLGRELPVTATDRCDGDASASLRITNATASNGGSGVLSWDGNSVCVVVERDGDEPERLYEVETSALDSNGNRSLATMRVRIPHHGPTANCTRPQTLQPCGETP
ncbi:MAG: hypothetical protein H0T89_16430 [Deltaproteobacteria bacterium]|nr:hypothetical protein [Deltaproteobacteria bacterium]MDQ3297607.1 hypothetical protein [Myxococcota bacterium]